MNKLQVISPQICGSEETLLSRNEQRPTSSLTLPTNFLTRKERLEHVSLTLLPRYVVDFNIPPMTPKQDKLTSTSWERHLTGSRCPPEEYERVYERAVQIYKDEGFGKGPFNVSYLLVAWDRIRAERQREVTIPRWNSSRNTNTKQLKAAPSCDLCLGTTLDYNRDESGKWLGIRYIKDEKGRSVVASCPKCGEDTDGEQESTQT